MAKSHVILGLAAWIAASPLLHLPAFDPRYLDWLWSVHCYRCGSSQILGWAADAAGSTAIAAALGHRGVTHSAIAVVALTLVLQHAGYRRGEVSALAVGYLSHLAADMLTPQGLRLTWPIRGTWSLPLCRTGSVTEAVVVTMLVCAVTWWVVQRSGGMAGITHTLMNGLN